MRINLKALHTVTAFLAFAGSHSSPAQQEDAFFSVHKDHAKITPAEIVRQFEAPELTTYLLGEGDQIFIDVWSHTDLSGRHTIGPDGQITVPIIGALKVAGLSREEAQRSIASSLAHFYADLSVTVRVDQYTSYRIFVLGRPGSPGVLQFDSQPTLLDVITRASSGAAVNAANEKSVLGRCAVLRGRDQIIWVDLRSLFTEGNMALNIRLERNDLVYLPDASDRVVYVLGEVKHPGAYPLTPTMSFLDAFSQAGGATVDASNTKLEVIRSTTGIEHTLSFGDLLRTPQQLNFSLEEGDILYVPRRGLAKFGYLLQQTSSLAGFAVIGTIGAR